MTDHEALALGCVDKFGDRVLVFLKLVRKFLLGERTLIPEKVDEQELLRSEIHLVVFQHSSCVLFQFTACKVKFYCYLLR